MQGARARDAWLRMRTTRCAGIQSPAGLEEVTVVFT